MKVIAVVAALVAVSTCNPVKDRVWTENENLEQNTLKALNKRQQASHFFVELDKPPAERWAHIMPLYKDKAKAVTAYIEEFIPKAIFPIVEKIATDLTAHFPKEFAEEMEANAKLIGLSKGEIVIVNLIYIVEHIGWTCPEANVTGPCPPKKKPAHNAPGLCTSIITETPDGKIHHGRNLDWSIPQPLRELMVDITYTRGGKVAFHGSQPVGFAGILHGSKPGAWSYSLNARQEGGDLIDNALEYLLVKGALCPTQKARMAMESVDNYDDAVIALSTGDLLNPAYFNIGGVNSKQGSVIARSRNAIEDMWHLEDQPANMSYFMLQTNYDHTGPPPSWDNRRDPGNKHMMALGANNATDMGVYSVLTQWPNFNHHTDFTAILSASNPDAYVTYIWGQDDP